MGMKHAGLLLFALALAGCGYRGPLSRIDPAGMERDELREARAQEKAQLDRALAYTPEQRPVRVDDITIRLEERTDDPFNLPPER